MRHIGQDVWIVVRCIVGIHGVSRLRKNLVGNVGDIMIRRCCAVGGAVGLCCGWLERVGPSVRQKILLGVDIGI